jgi:hypothetical protein
LITGSSSVAELYDPLTGTFTATGSTTDISPAEAVRLRDGKVLRTGLYYTEIYDPGTGTFSVVGPPAIYDLVEDFTMTLLESGSVLFTGGWNPFNCDTFTFSSGVLYVPETGRFQPAHDLSVSRAFHTATLLPGGTVLVAGGFGGGYGSYQDNWSAEIYLPDRNTFVPTGSMQYARSGHTATLFNDGQVLVAGGGGSTAAQTSAELYFNSAASANVALASNGATASASSSYSSNFPVSAIINNDRSGVPWGGGGVWADATFNLWPDSVDISFNGNKTIYRVVVYSVQDNNANPVEQPSDTMTFSAKGVQDFTLQGRSGSSWITLAAVTNNNLVKRSLSFAPATVDAIRITMTRSLSGYSQLTEVEAWNVAGLSPTTTTLVSSANPSIVGMPVTFTATVTGMNPSGSVGFTANGGNISSCASLGLAGLGNSKTASCTTSSLTAGTHSIVANYSGDGANSSSGSVALSQVVSAPGSIINVALAANGATASASSSYGAGYPASAVINNERAGTNWGAGGVWADATFNLWPDSVEISFTGNKTINRVVVYSAQDNYANPVEPSDTMAFSAYGVQDFTVQGRSGSNWITLASVTNNNLVKRSVSFAPATVVAIRITITRSAWIFSLLTEVEAWNVAVGLSPTTTTLMSSANPSMVGMPVTLTATVAGTNPSGGVGFTANGTTINGCSLVGLAGSGNSKAALCSTSSLTAGTHSIVASYNGDAANSGSSSLALSQVVNAAGGVNVALASAGATASASSSYSAGYPASAVINNERAGTNWGGGSGGWADGTFGLWPDSLEIFLNGNKTIDRVVVYSVQDNYANPVEPSNTMTFSAYGAQDFTVQGRSGSNWITLATVTNNNLVKRSLSFTPTTVNAIRITITRSAWVLSLLTEVEVWGTP